MKVIGIGLNKTGTSTLGAVGERLGLKMKTWDAALFHAVIVENNIDALWPVIETHDVFNDFPFPLVYRQIDANCPDTKFVLTRRADPRDWLASVKAHSMRAAPSSQTHKHVYGSRYPHGREQAFLDYYERHNDEARDYFADRPGDFLDLAWEEEADAGRLTTFLGLPPLDGPAPHANAAAGKAVNPLRYAYNVAGRAWQGLTG